MKRLLLIAVFFVNAVFLTAQIQTSCLPKSFELAGSGQNMRSMLADEDLQFVEFLPDTALKPVQDTQNRALWSGYVKECSYSPDNSGNTVSLPDGGKLWRLGIACPGAAAVGLVLDSFEIPDGAYVFVCDAHGNGFIGGFGAGNNNVHRRLPVRPFDSDSVVLEYYEPSDAAFPGTLRVASISYETVCPQTAFRRTGNFLAAENCSPHTSSNPELDNIKRGVCLQYIRDNNGHRTYYSTGSLINNPDGKPYIYTAAHNSYSNPGEAEDYVCYFNYEVPALDSLVRGTAECTVAGATVLAKSDDLDFALLELNTAPPRSYRPYMLGWTADGIDGDYLLCIQHPQGDTKRYSVCEDLSITTFCNANGCLYENGFFLIPEWIHGTTAAGSSGSPLIIMGGEKVVGALTGGASTCSAPYDDAFSRFALAFDVYPESGRQMKAWLDPDGEGIRSMDGREMYAEPSVRTGNIPSGGKPSIITLSSANDYYTGHNSMGHTAYAEKFEFETDQLLSGVYVMQYLSSNRYGNNTWLRIYEGGDVPGNLLYEAALPKYSQGNVSNISQAENFMAFPEEIRAGKSFYVSCELEYAGNMDMFSVYAAPAAYNTAYFEAGDVWSAFTGHPVRPQYLSLWIEPVLRDNHALAASAEDAPSTMSLLPNPTYGDLTVYGTDGSGFDYRIYDLSGRLCSQGHAIDGKIAMPAEPGFYVVSIHAGGGTLNEKVLKL